MATSQRSWGPGDSSPGRRALPPPLSVAVSLTFLEVFALVLEGFSLLPSTTNERAAMNVTSVAFFLLYGGALAWCAWNLRRLRSWARSPVVLAQLIQILTGVEVPSGGLPADIGMLCQNVGTCVAIHDAVVLGKPLITRITTLTGTALARPGNVEALLGTPVGELLEFAGLDRARLNRLIMGGPMMGSTMGGGATMGGGMGGGAMMGGAGASQGGMPNVDQRMQMMSDRMDMMQMMMEQMLQHEQMMQPRQK